MNNDDFLIIEQYQIAFKLDDGVILGYDTQYGEILLDSEGIMREIGEEFAVQIKEFFQIDLDEYGIKIIPNEIDIPVINNVEYKHR